MTLVFVTEAAFSKRSQVTCLSVPLQVQEKRTFQSIFSEVFERPNVFNAIIAIKHASLMHN